jgi:hypothetical protein
MVLKDPQQAAGIFLDTVAALRYKKHTQEAVDRRMERGWRR